MNGDEALKKMMEDLGEDERSDEIKIKDMKCAIRAAINYIDSCNTTYCEDYGEGKWNSLCKNCICEDECKLINKLKKSIR